MTLSEVQKAFTDEIRFVDDAAQIVLKGHLVAENLMNEAIERFVLHGQHIEGAKLQFHQKLAICKSISLSDNQNNMWNLLKQINVLRNALSHSLDGDRRAKAIQSLRSTYDQEFDRKTRVIEGMNEDAALSMVAISGVLGFLHSFLNEVKRFEKLVKALDEKMNSGELSSDV